MFDPVAMLNDLVKILHGKPVGQYVTAAGILDQLAVGLPLEHADVTLARQAIHVTIRSISVSVPPCPDAFAGDLDSRLALLGFRGYRRGFAHGDATSMSTRSSCAWDWRQRKAAR